MCRLTVYKGRPLFIGDVIISPDNSLLYQSRDAAYHPGVVDKTHQRNILVNGDGFGVSWYGDDVNMGSCCFKFVTPAWSDTNLRNIGRHITSSLIFAHVRAAASGHNPFEPMIVSNENCHPFTYNEFTFMHNGGIPSFQRIKLSILKLLSPETFANIKGTTDTEHIFAIYLNCLPEKRPGELHTVTEMVDAMNQTVSVVLQLCAEHGVTEHCSLNLCVTNGVHIIATRFRSGPRAPPSLYYNIGSKFVCRGGHFYAEDDTVASEIVISSAPLSKLPCPPGHPVECELDVSFSEPAAAASEANTPGARSALASPRPGLRALLNPSGSSANLAATPLSAHGASANVSAGPNHAPQGQQQNSDGSDSDIGSWILIPRNHMLVCQGDAINPHSLTAFYLEPVTVTRTAEPLSAPLYACRVPVPHTPCAVVGPGDSPSIDAWAGVQGGCSVLSNGHGDTRDSGVQGSRTGKRDATEAALSRDEDSDEEDTSGNTTALSTSTSESRLDRYSNSQTQQGGPVLARQVSAGPATGSPGCSPPLHPHQHHQHQSQRPCSGVVFSPKCKRKPKVIKFPCKMARTVAHGGHSPVSDPSAAAENND